MRTILERGGDTDTNMAIVGGMVGCLVGFKKIPAKYLEKMIRLDFTNQSEKRGN